MEQVRHEQARLRGFVRSLGVRSEIVDDLSQDAFVWAWKKIEDFQPGTDFGAWVREIARNLVRNELRKESRRQRLIGEHTATLLAAQDADAAESTAPDEQVVAALRGCVNLLPERSRALVQQRYFEDQNPGTIASRAGKSSNEIRQQLFRIRKLLMDCMEKKLALPNP